VFVAPRKKRVYTGRGNTGRRRDSSEQWRITKKRQTKSERVYTIYTDIYVVLEVKEEGERVSRFTVGGTAVRAGETKCDRWCVNKLSVCIYIYIQAEEKKPQARLYWQHSVNFGRKARKTIDNRSSPPLRVCVCVCVPAAAAAIFGDFRGHRRVINHFRIVQYSVHDVSISTQQWFLLAYGS